MRWAAYDRGWFAKETRRLKTSSQIRDLGSQFLFISEGFDGIELRCFDGGQHAADDAYKAENARGPDKSSGVNGQVNIAFVGAFLKCAP